MRAVWMYLLIVLGGVLQAFGAPMNGQLYASLGNRWLASAVSFALVFVCFACLFAVLPRPLPTSAGIEAMPWWAPVGGVVGAVQVYAGLTLVTKVGAGPFMGLTVTAALIASIVIDHFGLLRMPVHPMNALRLIGALLLVAGIALVARY
jgi:transporter family-2 protein